MMNMKMNAYEAAANRRLAERAVIYNQTLIELSGVLTAVFDRGPANARSLPISRKQVNEIRRIFHECNEAVRELDAR